MARDGGLDGVRDEGLLISAVEQPRSTFGGVYLHEDLFEMAAAYAFHLSQNQPFFEGNKRTAIGSAFLFRSLNGVFLDASQDGLLFDMLIAIANRQLAEPKKHLAKLFRQIAAATAARIADDEEDV